VSDDPVLQRRAQLAALAAAGQRVGWLLIGVAVVAFVVGLTAGFDPWGTVVVAALVACTLTLAPAIVLGYAVRAAAREEAGVERSAAHRPDSPHRPVGEARPAAHPVGEARPSATSEGEPPP
jgi:hypothetical protein